MNAESQDLYRAYEAFETLLVKNASEENELKSSHQQLIREIDGAIRNQQAQYDTARKAAYSRFSKEKTAEENRANSVGMKRNEQYNRAKRSAENRGVFSALNVAKTATGTPNFGLVEETDKKLGELQASIRNTDATFLRLQKELELLRERAKHKKADLITLAIAGLVLLFASLIGMNFLSTLVLIVGASLMQFRLAKQKSALTMKVVDASPKFNNYARGRSGLAAVIASVYLGIALFLVKVSTDLTVHSFPYWAPKFLWRSIGYGEHVLLVKQDLAEYALPIVLALGFWILVPWALVLFIVGVVKLYSSRQ